jgi:hypothetical protein
MLDMNNIPENEKLNYLDNEPSFYWLHNYFNDIENNDDINKKTYEDFKQKYNITVKPTSVFSVGNLFKDPEKNKFNTIKNCLIVKINKNVNTIDLENKKFTVRIIENLKEDKINTHYHKIMKTDKPYYNTRSIKHIYYSEINLFNQIMNEIIKNPEGFYNFIKNYKSANTIKTKQRSIEYNLKFAEIDFILDYLNQKLKSGDQSAKNFMDYIKTKSSNSSNSPNEIEITEEIIKKINVTSGGKKTRKTRKLKKRFVKKTKRNYKKNKSRRILRRKKNKTRRIIHDKII